MMRTIRLVLLSLAAFVTVVLPSTASAQVVPGEGDIVFIESQRIVNALPEAQEAQRVLAEERSELRAQLDIMEAKLDSLVSAYDQRQVMLSPEAKGQMIEEIRATRQEFQARAVQLEEEAQDRQSELLQPIMQRIQQVINELRAERGYAMILDASSSGIVAASATLDVTQEVIDRLQQAASGQDTGQ